MRSLKHVAVLILSLSILFTVFSDRLYAWSAGYGGGGGCCVPDSMIFQLARTFGVDGQDALDMMDRLSNETFADLRLLQSTPPSAQACDAYLICEKIPEPFFRVLLTETIERKKAEVLNAQQKRAFIFTLLTAIVALAGLCLSLFNTWHNVQKKGT